MKNPTDVYLCTKMKLYFKFVSEFDLIESG